MCLNVRTLSVESAETAEKCQVLKVCAGLLISARSMLIEWKKRQIILLY